MSLADARISLLQPTHCACSNKNDTRSCLLPALGRRLRVCFEHTATEESRWEFFKRTTFDSQAHVAECVDFVGPAADQESRWNELPEAKKSHKSWNAQNLILQRQPSCFRLLENGGLPVLPDVIVTDHASSDVLSLLETARTASNAALRVWIVHARRFDSAAMLGGSPIWHPNLAAHFREYALRNRSLYRSAPVGERYHWQLACDFTLHAQRKANALHPDQQVHACDGNDKSILRNDSNSKGEMASLRRNRAMLTDLDLEAIKVTNFNFGSYHNYLTGVRDFGASTLTRKLYSDAREYLALSKDLCDVFSVNHARDTIDGLVRGELATRLEALRDRWRQPLSISRWSGLLKAVGVAEPSRTAEADRSQSRAERKACLGRMGPHHYAGNFSRAKIAVCPWGFGERTACDEMAMLFGAVMLKPDTSHVEAFPDVYHPSTPLYVPVRHDLSDLESRIEHVLDNFKDYVQMRFLAQRLLLSVDMADMVRHFWNTLVGRIAVVTNGTFAPPTQRPLDGRRQALLAATLA